MSDMLSQIEEIQFNVREIKATWGNTVMMLDNIKSALKADRQKAIDDAYDRGYKECFSEHKFDVPCSICDDYERGLNDAWDAARKIVTWPDRSLVNSDTFDLDPGENIFTKYSASEAITKLRVYEEKQKADDEIKVSDEVVWTEDESVVIVVTRVYTENDVEWCDGVCRNGTVYQILTEHARKTGRRFDIESILKGMQS